MHRRDLLRKGLGSAAWVALPFFSQRTSAVQKIVRFKTSKLSVLSDGNLVLPKEFLKPPNMSEEVFSEFLLNETMSGEFYQPACNLTLWETQDRLVLFDIGAGENFMDSAGRLRDNLDAAGIDPEAITDIVITHAHPDHLWGLVDEFDELSFPNASYHMHQAEWDFWSDDSTESKMPASRKVFASGAKTRFSYLQDRIHLFVDGNEILPGIEAVLTPGHTPGHCSFAIHDNGSSALVVGDALTHPVLSFEPKRWLSNSDQDPEQGRLSRIKLLDRLAQEQTLMVAYHLPYPGVGYATQLDDRYEFVPTEID